MLAAGNDNNSERKNECLRVIDAYLKPKCHPADSMRSVGFFLSIHFNVSNFKGIVLISLSGLQRKQHSLLLLGPSHLLMLLSFLGLDEYTLPKIAERDLRRLANLRSTSSELGVDHPLQKIPVKCPVSRVVKQRKVQGTECFEVLWEGYDGLQTSIVPSDLLERYLLLLSFSH
ncbi:hypothetical protein OIU76_030074 [Salix suchowensis]|nr:hypothetical protein OIU76_030074 [Salix suchowensis]